MVQVVMIMIMKRMEKIIHMVMFDGQKAEI